MINFSTLIPNISAFHWIEAIADTGQSNFFKILDITNIRYNKSTATIHSFFKGLSRVKNILPHNIKAKTQLEREGSIEKTLLIASIIIGTTATILGSLDKFRSSKFAQYNFKATIPHLKFLDSLKRYHIIRILKGTGASLKVICCFRDCCIKEYLNPEEKHKRFLSALQLISNLAKATETFGGKRFEQLFSKHNFEIFQKSNTTFKIVTDLFAKADKLSCSSPKK